MNRGLILFLFFSVVNFSFGQNYKNLSFEHLDNLHGLISDEVYSSAQDKTGFLWFGTEEGLVRYDGYEFRTFKEHPYLGKFYGHRINVLHCDNSGNLYVGTSNGFWAFTPALEPYLVFASDQSRRQYIQDIHRAKSGIIYITSGQGLLVIDPEKQSIEKITPTKNNNMRTQHLKQIAEDEKGRIWIATWQNTLLRLKADGKTFRSFSIFPKNRDGQVGTRANNALFIDSYGFLWLGTWNMGVYVLDISGDKIHKLKHFVHKPNNSKSLIGDIVHSITEDKYNNIWVATPYGLSVIQYPLAQHYHIHNFKAGSEAGSLSNNVVTSLIHDNSDLIWVTTRGSGINKVYLDGNQFKRYKLPVLDEQIQTQAVHAFEKDQKGRLLIGALSLGFVVYDQKKRSYKHYREFQEYRKIDEVCELNTVNCFFWDNDSTLWLGTRYNGVILCHPKSGEVENYIWKNGNAKSFQGRDVYVFYKHKNGQVLVGTGRGVNILTKNKGKWRSRFVNFRKDGKMVSSGVFGIVPLGADSVLLATEKDGLYSLNLAEEKPQASAWSNTKERFLTAYKAQNGRIWLGTRGNGIKYIEPGEQVCRNFDSKMNNIGDMIYGFHEDKFANIWLTTNHGLTKVWTKQKEMSSESFFYRDGLQGNVFIPRAFFKDKKGRFYIGGHNGFNIFNPQRISSNNKKAPVALTDIFIEGERLNVTELKDSTLYLDHVKNDFSVTFSSLSYIFPEANRYAYMLKGIDKEWKYASAKMRSANYSNIWPGTYTFLLKGTNNQGIWSDQVLKLIIKVKPAPYKTWWAKLLYFFVLIGLISVFFLLRMRTDRIQQKMELERVARAKSEKLNQYKLGFFTNISHELLTPLAILSTAMDNMQTKQRYSKESLEIMQRNVNGLNRLLRQLLTFRKVETGNMKVKLREENITELLLNCASDFQLITTKKNQVYHVQIAEGLRGLADKDKWELIMRNLLSNACKYTPKGGAVNVLAKQTETGVLIAVSDTGKGISQDKLAYLFNRFYRVQDDVEDAEGGVGIGLNLTKSLVDILNGTVQVESTVGEGTTFTVELPIDNTALKPSQETVSLPEAFDTLKEEDSQHEEQSHVDDLLVLGSEKKPTVLLVEDNDDFRVTLKEALKDVFTILEADDGKQALKKASKEEIDLIVSDVMMPNMNGNELCKRLKSDINTSHIPIILLTAKVGDENRLVGYEVGANSYLEKPVDTKLLRVRIGGLLKQQEQMRNKTGISLNLEPQNQHVTSLDEEFFIKAKQTVEEHISDPDFSVKNLCEVLSVSNSMLYRKTKSLVGTSPSEFIRNIRLKRAAQLFDNKAFTISEVAYSCGFNDLSYFGVCFKKMYGVTPTAYQAGERKID